MRRFSTSLAGTFLLACFAAAQGQVLARPGWAGSGVAPESWWPRAVIYRLDPARFQDGNGDGKGDLAGLANRLDYLQALGVDAVLLDSESSEPVGAAATSSASSHIASEILANEVGDLVREASRHQLRVLLTVTPALLRGPRAALLQTVHSWLGAGAAGIFVPKPAGLLSGEGEYAALLASLQEQLHTFPGERVLLSDPAPLPLHLAPERTRQPHRIDPGSFLAANSRHLVTAALFAVHRDDIPQLRASLAAAGQDSGPGSLGLLQFAQPPATGAVNAAADAALLLGSRGAVVLDFGEELGLDLYPETPTIATSTPGAPARRAELPVMQWTPSNRTSTAPTEAEHPQTPASPAEPQFGSYHPYQPPPRDLRAPVSAPTVRVAPDMNVPVALPAPDSLAGFTSAEVATVSPQVAQRNATTEDRDPRSLLNVYRTLIALHHGNAALRNGGEVVLNHDQEAALVWLRRPPAGARTVQPVLGAVNLSSQPLTLALDADLAAQGLHAGALRPLFRSSPETMTGESTGALRLPPHGVFLGELTRGAAGRERAEPAARVRRSRRHRVRR